MAAEPVIEGDAQAAGRKRRWSEDDSIALFGVSAIAGVLRFFRLGTPSSYVFDEVYYAKEACMYMYASERLCEVKNPPAEVHPPLAKWIMGLGIKIFGYSSFGWRVAAAAAGLLTVVLLYLLARRLFNTTSAALVTSGVLAFDPMHFVNSRTALLDIFVPLFGVAAFLFLVIDRDTRLAREGPEETAPRHPLNRPWRAAAGIAAAGAVASKWSGGLVLIAILVLSVVWGYAALSNGTLWSRLRIFVRREVPSLLLYLALLPLVAYLATFIGRIDGNLLAAPGVEGAWLTKWWDFHRFALDFHIGLEGNHAYQSPPWAWVLMKRAFPYFFETGTGGYREILAVGNPLVWWPSLIALGYVALRWIKRRDFLRPEGTILTGFAATYLLWVLLARNRPAVFIFYILPALPFMALAFGYFVDQIAHSRRRLLAVVGLSILALSGFAFYYPMLTNVPISRDAWEARIFVFDNCDKPKPLLTTRTATVTHGTSAVTRTRTTFDKSERPPEGWCWI